MAISKSFLDFLTKELIRFEPSGCLKLQIRTQWSFSGGTPDILIRGHRPELPEKSS